MMYRYIKVYYTLIDLVAIPDFSSGAMENWGLITYRMTAVLYDPKHSSSRDKEWVAIVVAHELAHQVRFPSNLHRELFVCLFYPNCQY